MNASALNYILTSCHQLIRRELFISFCHGIVVIFVVEKKNRNKNLTSRQIIDSIKKIQRVSCQNKIYQLKIEKRIFFSLYFNLMEKTNADLFIIAGPNICCIDKKFLGNFWSAEQRIFAIVQNTERKLVCKKIKMIVDRIE